MVSGYGWITVGLDHDESQWCSIQWYYECVILRLLVVGPYLFSDILVFRSGRNDYIQVIQGTMLHNT